MLKSHRHVVHQYITPPSSPYYTNTSLPHKYSALSTTSIPSSSAYNMSDTLGSNASDNLPGTSDRLASKLQEIKYTCTEMHNAVQRPDTEDNVIKAVTANA